MNIKPPNKTHTPHTTQRLVFSSEERPHEPRLSYIQTNIYIHTHTHAYLPTYIYTYRWGREWVEIQREGLGPEWVGFRDSQSQAKQSLAVHQCALVHKIWRWSPRSKGCWLQPQVYQVKGAWSLRGTTGTTTHATLASFLPPISNPIKLYICIPP